MAATGTFVLLNPAAAGGRAARAWPGYADELRRILGAFSVVVTAGRGDATGRVRAAVASGARRIVVIGGDGTLNEAINGLTSGLSSRLSSALSSDLTSDSTSSAANNPIDPDLRFGFVPCGTGTDFARSVGFGGRDAVHAAFEALRTGRERRIDLGRVSFGGSARLFINVAGCGLAGDVVRAADAMPWARALGARALFLCATLRALVRYRPQPVRVTIDGDTEELDDLTTLAVANGRCFGGGMCVAPEARLDDGLFDVVIIRGARSKVTLLPQLPRLYDGSHVALPIVQIRRARSVSVTPLSNAVAPLWLDVDGESPAPAPASFDVLPAALRLLA